MDIFKILAVCLITAVLAILLKQYKAEYSIAVVLGGGIIAIIFVIKSISAPIDYLKSEIEASGINTEYFKAAFKALGIGYITGFIADACRDSGQNALAAKAELAGKCAVFIISLPLISSILQTALGFIK